MTDLTYRERQVARLTAEGLTNAEIADELGISYQTVKNHKSTIYSKLDVRNAVELTLRIGTGELSRKPARIAE